MPKGPLVLHLKLEPKTLAPKGGMLTSDEACKNVLGLGRICEKLLEKAGH
jgi:hypothetical protein